MGTQVRTVEEKLGSIAAGQHGVATRAQLLTGGVTVKEIAARVRNGALLRVHRGVYRVGHLAPSVHATYLAAVLAAGADARLRGRAAAHLWGLVKGQAPPPEVVAPSERRIEGVKVRRVRKLHPSEVTTFRAIPITTVARTLVDLAAEFTEDELARACHEAGVRHRTTPADVAAVLGMHPSSPGAAKLRRVMEGDIPVTLSKLEARFLKLVSAQSLPPPPHTNRPAGGRRVDCRWPQHGLTVELDGYRFHNSRHSWEQDRRREREARARGDEFRRYTYRDVFEDPVFMLAELAAFFAATDRQSSSSSSSSGSGPAFSSSST
jgi:very-short-patch-repair endonuclease